MAKRCEGPASDSGVDAMVALRRRIIRQCVPASGTLVLTDRCPLRCTFCYNSPEAPRPERDAAFWRRVIDEIVAAGCLSVLFSGGDPMVRPDFPALYMHARRQGVLVTVFASGAILPDAALAAFRDLPPNTVELSLYGASPDAYRRICGDGGAYDRILGNIARLQAAGIEVRLKTMLARETLADLPAIRSVARQLGCRFRFDGCLFPRLDGGRRPLDSRLSPDSVVAEEFRDPAVAAEWRRFATAFGGTPPDNQRFNCGAGRTAFHVDADGTLRPCLMVRDPAFPLDRPFSEQWPQMVQAIQAMRLPEDNACRSCPDRVYCGYCPGFFELETGENRQPSGFLCRLGRLRRERVTEHRTSNVER